MKKTLLWYPGIAAAGGLLFAVCEQIEDHILHDYDFLKAAMFVIAVLTAAAIIFAGRRTLDRTVRKMPFFFAASGTWLGANIVLLLIASGLLYMNIIPESGGIMNLLNGAEYAIFHLVNAAAGIIGILLSSLFGCAP